MSADMWRELWQLGVNGLIFVAVVSFAFMVTWFWLKGKCR